MDIQHRIKTLSEQHQRLDNSTSKLEKELAKFPDDVDLQNKLRDLKKKKLSVRDELNALYKQDLEDSERFDFSEWDR